jgi:transcriptional regulator with XRE-family HTH domain
VKSNKQSLRQLAVELGISPSYLSMINSGQRKCPSELIEKLQSVHRFVNSVNGNQLQIVHGVQGVAGSNPVSPTFYFH